MTRKLDLPEAPQDVTPGDARRHAPAVAKNAEAILAALREIAPAQGRALEIAAGSGEHAVRFAPAFPGLAWQPTDLDPANLASIAAWAAAMPSPNLLPPVALNAAEPGWSAAWAGRDLIFWANLLHLISDAEAEIVVAEAAAALAPGGVLAIYGPFLRDGQATSEGDAAFHAHLRAQDPAIGYKDAAWVEARLARAGLSTTRREMPSNNLILHARRS